MTEEIIQPFDAFAVVYKLLMWTGYFKLLNKPKNRFKHICHQMYRALVIIMVIVFNLQHLTFIVQRRGNMDDVFESLMIEVPQINLIVKILTLNLQIPRIDALNKLINEPIFGPKTKQDAKLLLQNITDTHRLTKVILSGISIAALSWPAYYLVRRYQDETAVVPSYVPFDTSTWGRFSISVLIEVVPVFWVGYGHIALDCLVATYYAQAAVQLKIIKQNLEQIFDNDKLYASVETFKYRDVANPELKDKFVYYVQRYEKLAWYLNEINQVFNPSVGFQFITSSLSLCMVVNRMSSISIASVPFIFLMFLSLLFVTQVFLYCYFGNLVQIESESMVDSLYLSEWLSVSPKFRRMLLIAMLRWSWTLTPTVLGVIPLSLNTFISIIRSAYSLLAVLGTKQS